MKKPILTLSLFFLLLGIANAQDRIKSDIRMPVLGWYGIPAGETTPDRYQEMHDAGITHMLTTFPDVAAMQKALDVAQKTGVKLLVSCPELVSDPENTVRRFMNHPAVAGYHLIDEPSMADFPKWGSLAKRIQAVDGKHFCYLNLFPNFAEAERLGTKDYREYVRECAKQIPLQFLSFDFYPVFRDHLASTWYENLEQVSDEARKAGKPFWAFALTTNFDNDHLTPQTLASIRLQVYSDLAYGAQGIQYFTYWSATSMEAPSAEDQRGAPISAAGKRSAVYDRVREMSEEIRNLSGVFLGSRVVMVRHTGMGMIPSGTVRLTTLPPAIKVLNTGGAPALVSILEKGNQTFLVVVNKDFQHSIQLTVSGDETLKKVLKDGTLVPASAYESTLELDAGDAAIWMFTPGK